MGKPNKTYSFNLPTQATRRKKNGALFAVGVRMKPDTLTVYIYVP